MAHRAEGLDDIFEHSIIARDNITAKNFYGDGSGLTNLPVGTESDPIFNAASAAITASLALVDPHIADSTIHYVNPGFLTSETDPIFNAASAAINNHIASSAIHYVNPGFLTVDTFQAASAAITASLALVDPHIANATIHFTSNALWASMALINTEYQATSGAYTTHAASGAIHFTSNALWSSMAICYAASAALTTHTADTSDPHGATVTQTNLQVASCAITADNTASGAAVCRNILIGTEASGALTASNYNTGTIYLKYT